MSVYRRDFDKTKCMSFFIKDKKLLEKYNEIWKKVSKIIKKGCDSNLVYNGKYLKNKLKVYDKKINTDFHGNKMPKKYICLSVILLDYIFTTVRNYYPRVFLEKCKYVIKEKIIVYYL